MTPKQKKLYNFIKRECEKNHRPPNLREMGEYMGMTFQGADAHAKALIKKGKLKYIAGKGSGRNIVPV